MTRLWADRPSLVAAILTLAGLAIAGYLTYVHYEGICAGLHHRWLRARPGVQLLGDRRRPGRAARADRLRRDRGLAVRSAATSAGR